MLPLSISSSTTNGFNQEPTESTTESLSTKRKSAVGLVRWKGPDLANQLPGCWAFTFALKDINDPKYGSHVASLATAGLFGHAESGEDVLIKMSGAQGAERARYTFTLVSM